MPAVVPKKSAPSDDIQAEALGLADVDLTGAPELRPYNTLRMRERTQIIAVADAGGEELRDANGEKRDPTLAETFEWLAQMDEAMEAVAVDRQAYLEWLASDKGGEQGLSALFARYAEQVGKSMSSAN